MSAPGCSIVGDVLLLTRASLGVGFHEVKFARQKALSPRIKYGISLSSLVISSGSGKPMDPSSMHSFNSGGGGVEYLGIRHVSHATTVNPQAFLVWIYQRQQHNGEESFVVWYRNLEMEAFLRQCVFHSPGTSGMGYVPPPFKFLVNASPFVWCKCNRAGDDFPFVYLYNGMTNIREEVGNGVMWNSLKS